jgi:hypothetical protein
MSALKASDLMQEMRVAQTGDWWGDTMSWWFAVAGEMYTRNMPIPTEWHYRPGINPKDDSYEAEICEQAGNQALLIFGRALTRYAAKLKQAGKDY